MAAWLRREPLLRGCHPIPGEPHPLGGKAAAIVASKNSTKMKDFTRVPNRVIRGESFLDAKGESIIDKETKQALSLSHGAFRLFALLRMYCYGDRTECWPSQETLSAQMGGVSRRQLYRFTTELAKARLVRVKQRVTRDKDGSGKAYSSNTYTLIGKEKEYAETGAKRKRPVKKAHSVSPGIDIAPGVKQGPVG